MALRHGRPSTPRSAHVDPDEYDRLLPPPSSASSSTQAPTPHAILAEQRLRKRRSIWIIGLLVLVLPYLLTMRRKQIEKRNERNWVLGERYSLCSSSGKNVYTSEVGLPRAECVVIDAENIIYVGDRKTVKSQYPSFKLQELPKGAILTSGFVDSHAHTLEYGWSRQLPLAGSSSIQSIVEKLESYVQSHKEEIDAGAWIEGLGWDQTKWPVKEFPTSADLDRSPSLRGLPIALKRIDVHAEWLSPKALSLLGDLPDTVEGGRIVRYPDGTPTGVFLDDAMFLIDAVRPKRTEAQKTEYLERAVKDAASKGLTGIHDAGVEPADVDFFARAGHEGKLPIKFYIMRACPDKDNYCGGQYPKLTAPHMIVNSVKLFGDGALGRGFVGAIHGPTGSDWNDEERRRDLETVDQALCGKRLCIGDKANHLVIDAMEYALKATNKTDADVRLRIEHAQIMTPNDISRAADLGIIASFQPTHATSDMWYAEERLGSERIKGAYAWRTYLEAGGRITLGSDFPVEDIDPLYGFFAAVTRTDHNLNSPHGTEGWYASQKLSRMEALRGMTIDPAFASFQEAKTGSLLAGKKADMVIWSKDILRVPPREILRTKVLATIVDGAVVYRHGAV